MLSDKAVLEIMQLNDDAARLSKGNATDRAEATRMLAHISTIKQFGYSSDEMRQKYSTALLEQITPVEDKVTEARYTKAFCSYLFYGEKAMDRAEHRDLLAGQQSITYTQGVAGGFFVDQKTESDMKAAFKNIDPLLSSDVCDFQMSDGPKFQPTVISGFDLSSIEATLITETSQQTAGAFPNVLGATLRSNLIYRATLAASFEALTDVPDALPKFAQAFGVAIGRAVSSACVTGNGGTQPQGVLTALTNRVYTTGTGKIVLDDVTGIYFALDRYWRVQPKTAWLMSDSVYQRVRQATDNSGRPLLRVQDGAEVLMGKPVYVTPSLPVVGGSIGGNSEIVFGDMNSFHVRMSRPVLQRALNASTHGAEYGECLFICRTRVDATYFDASSGNSPALVAATVTA